MANRLRAEMQARGYSYRDLGFLCGKSPAFLCRIAAGKRRPSRKTALAIAKAMGVAPSKLWSQE